MKKPDVISVREAGDRLGIGKDRVLVLIKQDCPQCHGEPAPVRCTRCRGTGQRLPATKLGDTSRSPWMVYEWGLELPDVKFRPPGKPQKK